MTSIAASSIEERVASLVVPDNTPWMSYPWTIVTTNDTGVAKQDVLRLRANGTIEIQKGKGKQSVPWSKPCLLTSAGLSGVTLDGRSFLIRLDSATRTVTCTIPAPPLSQATILARPPSQATPSVGQKSDATWVAEEGGPGTILPPPDSASSGPSKG